MATKVRVCAIPGVNLRDYNKTAAQRGWGSGWPACDGVKQFKLVTVVADRSGTKITVNARVGRLIDALIDETERRGYLLKPGKTGGNNCRPIGGTNRPSNHSWGLAVDVNWDDNPYTTTGKHDIPDWVYDLWARYGFANGGDYTGDKKDWMHLEFMGTPEQADQATDLVYREVISLATVAAAPKSRRLDDMSNGMLPADRDGEFYFVVHAGDGASGLVSDCWITLASRAGITGRWRWVGKDNKPTSEYAPFTSGPYQPVWAASPASSKGPGSVMGIEGFYSSESPVGWEIEKKPR